MTLTRAFMPVAGGRRRAGPVALAAAAVWLAALPVGAEPPTRVVALGGAVTEIVVALGAQDLLVGRDTTSTYPPSVTALPDVGYVRALSPEGVMGLAPDLILAEAGAGPVEAVSVLKAAGIPYVALPEGLSAEGVVQKIETVGRALEREDRAAELAAGFRAQMAQAADEAAAVATPKRVLFVLSLQGGRVMAAGQGTSAEAIIGLAGGVSAAQGFSGFKPMTDEAILAAQPDVLLMMDREGDMAVTQAEVLAQPALASTPAAQQGAIVRMDGMLLLGFGPRTPQAVQALHRALYNPAEGAPPGAAAPMAPAGAQGSGG